MAKVAKWILNGCAFIVMSPCALVHCITATASGRDSALASWSQAISLLPGKTGCYMRRAFYSMALKRCDVDSVVSFGTVFSSADAEIHRAAYIGVYCCIGNVVIAEDVLIGSRVSIMNGSRQHGISRLDIPVREQPGEWPQVRIGRDSWVGDGAIIMCDIGEHCVVGAGAVVTKPLCDFAIAVGSPAKVIGYRNARDSIDSEMVSGSVEADILRIR